MTIGSFIPFNFKALNPFKKSLKDYDATDIVFSQFKDKNSKFDDRIVLINIGKPDRAELNTILQKVQTYNPKVIGIDIHLEELMQPEIDSSLRNTIKSYDNIILSKILTDYNPERKRYDNLEGCHEFFCDSTRLAYTNFYGKPGMTIRQFSPVEEVNGQEYFSLGAAMSIFDNPGLRDVVASRSPVQHINYIGDKDAFINIDKDQILTKNLNLEDAFKDKYVLIGYLGTDEWEESIKDKFITPFNPKLGANAIPDMYGVTIHANIAHMIIEQRFINKLSSVQTAVINFFLIFLLAMTFNKIYTTVNAGYWKIIKVIQLLLFALLFLIVSGVMFFFDIKLELGVGIVGAVLSWDAVKWYNNLILKRQSFFQSKSK